MTNGKRVNTEARRISPRGLITLPSQAQKAMGLDDSKTARVDLEVGEREVILKRSDSPTRNSPRVSPGGLMQLSAEAHEALAGRSKGTYSCEFGDGAVVLRRAG
jgi:hypothetical protein